MLGLLHYVPFPPICEQRPTYVGFCSHWRCLFRHMNFFIIPRECIMYVIVCVCMNVLCKREFLENFVNRIVVSFLLQSSCLPAITGAYLTLTYPYLTWSRQHVVTISLLSQASSQSQLQWNNFSKLNKFKWDCHPNLSAFADLNLVVCLDVSIRKTCFNHWWWSCLSNYSIADVLRESMTDGRERN